MISFKQFILEAQEHTSAETSMNQVSGGIIHAVRSNLIKPKSINVDVGGGKYDVGKEHVESSVENSELHIYDPFNRSEEHNTRVKTRALGNSDYVGLHNVLNVIKEPEERYNALQNVKSFIKPKTGIAHITVYEGDKSGNGKISKPDKGKGSSWQEHRSTSSYVDEVKAVFPEATHTVERKGKHIIVKPK